MVEGGMATEDLIETPEAKAERVRLNRVAGMAKAWAKRGTLTDREKMRRAAMWASDYGIEDKDKAPNKMAERLLLLAEENPAAFMRTVVIPLLLDEKEDTEAQKKKELELDLDECRARLDKWWAERKKVMEERCPNCSTALRAKGALNT
jgi:hypothetical protein